MGEKSAFLAGAHGGSQLTSLMKKGREFQGVAIGEGGKKRNNKVATHRRARKIEKKNRERGRNVDVGERELRSKERIHCVRAWNVRAGP